MHGAMLPLSNVFSVGWSGTKPSITEAIYWPQYQPWMMMTGTVGGMIDSGNQSTQRKRAPLLFFPPQIPHDLTRAAAVGSQRLTIRAMTWP
jgi:hypothetical protein